MAEDYFTYICLFGSRSGHRSAFSHAFWFVLKKVQRVSVEGQIAKFNRVPSRKYTEETPNKGRLHF